MVTVNALWAARSTADTFGWTPARAPHAIEQALRDVPCPLCGAALASEAYYEGGFLVQWVVACSSCDRAVIGDRTDVFDRAALQQWTSGLHASPSSRPCSHP